MLRATELAVRRGATRVVEGFDLDVRPGRPVWIVGPNGAGKTSLLRVLAGLDPPAAGFVERPSGPLLYYHSEMTLPADATVCDWARLVRVLLPAAGAARPTELWPRVPASRAVGRLSTGERKRLLLDVLLRQPGGLVLLDEPYEHLSPDAKQVLTAVLQERARDRVVVVATNQLSWVGRGDGGLHLEGGHVKPLKVLP